MHSENYKLYRKHKTELFEIVHEAFLNAPPLSIFATEEEKEEHKKKMDEYLKSIKPEVLEKLKTLGFGKET